MQKSKSKSKGKPAKQGNNDQSAPVLEVGDQTQMLI